MFDFSFWRFLLFFFSHTLVFFSRNRSTIGVDEWNDRKEPTLKFSDLILEQFINIYFFSRSFNRRKKKNEKRKMKKKLDTVVWSILFIIIGCFRLDCYICYWIDASNLRWSENNDYLYNCTLKRIKIEFSRIWFHFHSTTTTVPMNCSNAFVQKLNLSNT